MRQKALPWQSVRDLGGVDVMLVGHNHIYHRWAPQSADGTADVNGIRQFTIGTGGRSLYPLGKSRGQPICWQSRTRRSGC